MQFFKKKCKSCKKRHENKDVLCDVCGDGIIMFGKYKDYTFKYVINTENDYCEWILQHSCAPSIHFQNFYNYLKKHKNC